MESILISNGLGEFSPTIVNAALSEELKIILTSYTIDKQKNEGIELRKQTCNESLKNRYKHLIRKCLE